MHLSFGSIIPILVLFIPKTAVSSPCTGLYEEWASNGCNPFCSLEYQNPCPNDGPEKGCYCIKGMIRDINSRCISAESCSEALCPDGTKTLSVNGCSPYCSGPGSSGMTCVDAQPKCVCKDGYAEIWDNTTPTGICVPISQCVSPSANSGRSNDIRAIFKRMDLFQKWIR